MHPIAPYFGLPVLYKIGQGASLRLPPSTSRRTVCGFVFPKNGFPSEHLGDMLRMVCGIKVNGLESLLKPFWNLEVG